MSQAGYHEFYLSGIECFNSRAFFQSHEVWEDLWRETAGPEKEFLKGLIQAAVALYHLERGNIVGARRLLDGARQHLTPYAPNYLGLDVEQLLDQVAECFAAIPDDVSRLARDRVLVNQWPKIQLTPPHG
jgi:uncharacterized protein